MVTTTTAHRRKIIPPLTTAAHGDDDDNDHDSDNDKVLFALHKFRELCSRNYVCFPSAAACVFVRGTIDLNAV